MAHVQLAGNDVGNQSLTVFIDESYFLTSFFDCPLQVASLIANPIDNRFFARRCSELLLSRDPIGMLISL